MTGACVHDWWRVRMTGAYVHDWCVNTHHSCDQESGRE